MGKEGKGKGAKANHLYGWSQQARLLALQIIKPVILFDVFVPIRIPKDELS